MVQRVRRTGLAIFTALAIFGYLGQVRAAAEERFEISSIKEIRPTLVDTITALQQRDVARARAAFADYDSGWNGIEVYVNARSKDMYRLLELEFQPRITKALDKLNPDIAEVLTDVQAMLAKFDEAVSLFANAAPLNPLYDDVARLRIVRAHLREVTPALKAGKIAKARKSFESFEDGWFNIEDFVRAQSLDAYVAIETGMVQIEQALLMSDQPDVAAVDGTATYCLPLTSNVMGGAAKPDPTLIFHSCSSVVSSKAATVPSSNARNTTPPAVAKV